MAAALAVPAPLPVTERIVSLDVVRGLCLLGVLVSNVWLFFSGTFLQFEQARATLSTLSLDTLAFRAISILIAGKAMTTLGFLFGFGFGLQVERNQARGTAWVGSYARRLGTLLLIGVLHGTLLWFGDILNVYAVAGVAMLAFRNRSPRALLVWAGIFFFLLPLLYSALPLVLEAWRNRPPPAPSATGGVSPLLQTLQSGSYREILWAHLQILRQRAPVWLMAVMESLGIFLVGLWAVRRKLLARVEQHPRGALRLAWSATVLGLLMSAALAFSSDLFPRGSLWFRLGWPQLRALSNGVTALGYVTLVLVLVLRVRWRPVLDWFVPVGRIPLTTYLSQSVLCLAIFYGGGLVGRIGAADALGISLGLFIGQTLFAQLWLARFRFGPMEWLWRSLTYARAQPMRR